MQVALTLNASSNAAAWSGYSSSCWYMSRCALQPYTTHAAVHILLFPVHSHHPRQYSSAAASWSAGCRLAKCAAHMHTQSSVVSASVYQPPQARCGSWNPGACRNVTLYIGNHKGVNGRKHDVKTSCTIPHVTLLRHNAGSVVPELVLVRVALPGWDNKWICEFP